MQRQINYGTCTVLYNGNYSVSDVIIKMSLKTDKYFFHFMKLIIILTFVKYISKPTLTNDNNDNAFYVIHRNIHYKYSAMHKLSCN